MINLVRDNEHISVATDIQASAFLSSGWTIENTRVGNIVSPSPKVETPQENLVSEEKAYTKTEIARLSTSELQTLAIEVGIEDAESKSGTQLKKILVEHFGL